MPTCRQRESLQDFVILTLSHSYISLIKLVEIMGDGILKEVLQLEQEIEADLADEQARAEAWLAEACRAVDRDLSGEQQDEDLASEQKSAAAIRTARDRAAGRLRRERQWAKALVGMSSDRLSALLDSRLQPVLTGRDDDCPDDKS